MSFASLNSPQSIIAVVWDVVQLVFTADLMQYFVIVCVAFAIIALILCLIGLRRY